MMYRVTYTHNRAAGLMYSWDVEAPDEATATMQGSIARSTSFEAMATAAFFYPDIIKWTHVHTTERQP